ncbi:MAG: hypothetical protein RLZ98_2683 [Pseudomonadota bacterium]|jgi:pyruvate dehydrogenase E1 component beta subunit
MAITEMSYAEAFLTALGKCMQSDTRVSLLGRPFSLGPTRPLSDKLRQSFPGRVAKPPTSEAANAAMGTGAAMAGMRPFVDLATGSFSLLALSAIVNEAAVGYYMSGGRLPVPVTFHITHGVRGSGAPQHSHDMHTFVWNAPGLEVVLPATPADAYGLVPAALASPNPTFIMSHFKLISLRGAVDTDAPPIPLGKAEIKRSGKDVTIVALSIMVPEALAAAEKLAGEGIECDVIDPRTLSPLDEETILASVAKTGRLVVADESPLHGGAASGIAGMVADKGFASLKAPIARVARPDTPVPASPEMEAYVVPSEQHVVAAVRRVINA